jgi:hypothetical protein
MSQRTPLQTITPGEEATVLAPLPLSVLDLTDTQAETFGLWGINTLGMLAALPKKELIARMGQDGKRLRQLARGALPHLFQPVEQDFALEERMELDTPVELLDSLMFVVGVMLDQLILRAKARILALASVTITLSLDGGASHSRTVRPALPTTDKQLWIKLLHLDLEAHPPQASILAVVLKDCLERIPKHHGDQVDLAQLPEDDDVYGALQRADTVGMFQVESRAQMASLPRNYPKRFYERSCSGCDHPARTYRGQDDAPVHEASPRKRRDHISPSLSGASAEANIGSAAVSGAVARMAMTVANFTDAEAEELRRAVGMRRSWERMKNLEGKLRAGMTANEIDVATQETIIQNISSFALYGFPESHAASFALIAYASAYFKVKYLAAFTCAILNNQPIGFYSPAVLVKDAQRHGLRVKPIDVQVSEWACTIEHEDNGTLSLRMGLRYAKGMREVSAQALIESRRKDGLFRASEDLALRVPSLNRKELTLLARSGALNQLDGITHRRDALWQVERAGKLEGPLLRQRSEWLRDDSLFGR